MPTDTFYNLPNSKKKKIIKAAQKEFARVEFEQTSIKNIVEEAEIARGSFYQYFESKEDLLKYILEIHAGDIENKIQEILISNNGDIFELFIDIYNSMLEECTNESKFKFFRRIIENIKTSQGSILESGKPENILEKNKHLVNQANLRIKSEEDYKTIIRILESITIKAMATTFQFESKEEAKKEYYREIEFLKNGILKNKESEA